MKRVLIAMALAIAPAGAAWANHEHGAHDAHAGHTMTLQSMLAASTPSDGAVLATAPRTLSMTFAHPVILQTVAITGPGDAPVRATFRRPNAATASYSIALPALAAGAYEARWTASGQGHQMQGVVRFTVQ
ncbi:MAG: copper resistance CopC family protein [Hyphomonadaceae bacterium]